GNLLAQLDEPLATALKLHPTLSRYIVCFPTDLTGKTNRKGRSGVEKFQYWRDIHEQATKSRGRTLVIEPRSASILLSLMLKYDVSGGIRQYFFNEIVLSPSWLTHHLTQARASAEPR